MMSQLRKRKIQGPMTIESYVTNYLSKICYSSNMAKTYWRPIYIRIELTTQSLKWISKLKRFISKTK